MSAFIEQLVGALLGVFVLADIFLTVLYARIGPEGAGRLGAGILGNWVATGINRVFHAVSRRVGCFRDVFLSFTGPVALVLVVSAWAGGLTLAASFILQPHLGTGMQVSNGTTPTDFVAALYAAGTSLAITGSSEFAPTTSPMRIVSLGMSLIGASMVSLVITYLLQVYTALRERNTLAMHVHLLSASTGDAAEFIARIGPRGDFSGGFTSLASVAESLASVKEAHHFYPMLFYFRPVKPYSSACRLLYVALDSATLIGTALDGHRLAMLTESGVVHELGQVAFMMACSLEGAFLSSRTADGADAVDKATEQRWRRRYADACLRLRQAGIPLCDGARGADEYVKRRAVWDPHVRHLCEQMGYALEEIGAAACAPEQSPRNNLPRLVPGP